MKRLLIAAAAGLGVTALILAGCGVFESRDLNVLLISVDTLRQDHLGCYGYEIVKSPNIDRLSEGGYTFDDALASVPLTLPSHSSALTGLYPISHGVRDNTKFRLALEFETLAEVLSGRGYMTGGFVGSFVLDSRYGLDQGFDFYEDDMSRGSQGSDFMFPERTADLVNAAAMKWFEDVEEPYFAFVHYYDPHTPYEPPGRLAVTYADRPYDGEIEFADTEMGKLLAYLEERGLLDNTLIVFMSDHGEGLGEHSEDAHGVLVYESTLKVPLIIHMPEGAGPGGLMGAPARIPDTVRLIDIFPTVLDILGIDARSGLDGRSLVPLMKGHSLPPEATYFESLYAYFAYRWSPLKGVRLNQWKYILAPREELYNVEQDPGELRNHIDAEQEIAGQMSVALGRMLEREVAPEEASGVSLNADEIARLRALGYIAGGSTELPEPADVSGADPKDMMAHVNAYLSPGENAFNVRDFEKALVYFKRLAEVDPDNPQAHLHTARTYFMLGRYDEAKVKFYRALEIDSTESQAYFQLGNIAQAEDDIDAALELYERSLHFMPGSPEALANIGAALMQKGHADSAEVRLKQALEVDPKSPTALLNLGVVYNSREMYEEAIECYRNLLAVEPGNISAITNIAGLYVKMGNPDSTLAYFLRAESIAPGDPQVLFNVGNSYRQMGMNKEAGEYYEKVLAMQPDNVLALFGMAAVESAEGNREESMNILRRILRIDPGFQPAQAALETLASGSQ